jgi:hypothetical protein
LEEFEQRLEGETLFIFRLWSSADWFSRNPASRQRVSELSE